jgi:hypothetical protein
MAEPLVISALMKRRAEIDGKLRQVEIRAAQLRADRNVIDATIGMFDATKVPQTIRPRVRRPKPIMFKNGECSRAVMGILRVAGEPLNAKEIAERLVAEYHLDIREPHQHAALLHSIRNAVLRHSGKKVDRSERGGMACWKIKD